MNPEGKESFVREGKSKRKAEEPLAGQNKKVKTTPYRKIYPLDLCDIEDTMPFDVALNLACEHMPYLSPKIAEVVTALSLYANQGRSAVNQHKLTAKYSEQCFKVDRDRIDKLTKKLAAAELAIVSNQEHLVGDGGVHFNKSNIPAELFGGVEAGEVTAKEAREAAKKEGIHLQESWKKVYDEYKKLGKDMETLHVAAEALIKVV